MPGFIREERAANLRFMPDCAAKRNCRGLSLKIDAAKQAERGFLR